MRLDQALAVRGLVKSRTRARQLIETGFVEADGAVVLKPSREVSEETGIPLERLQIVKNACARAITLGEKFFEPRKRALENTFHPRSLNATPPAGVDDPGLICITDHCYKRDGIWHLKHTWWYAMELTSIGQNGTLAGNLLDASPNASDASPDSPALTPQTEEGISAATWVAPQDIPALLARAYSSIPEVLRHIEACAYRPIH